MVVRVWVKMLVREVVRMVVEFGGESGGDGEVERLSLSCLIRVLISDIWTD